MQTMNPYLQQYKKNQIETATPEKILILLYDGAIQYLNKAKLAIEENNEVERSSNIFNCEKIIIEFMNTLDMENGGKFAKELHNLYRYLYKTLVSANVGANVSKIDEVLTHLINLRATWQKAIEISNAEKQLVSSSKDGKKAVSDESRDNEYEDKYGDDEDDDDCDDDDEEDEDKDEDDDEG